MDDVIKTIELLKRVFPDSSLEPVRIEWLTEIEKKYSDIPENLKFLYLNYGYGTIGNSYYSIHVLLEPDDIYDQETATKLNGIYIVGDNFGGDCHAYDAKNNWTFGIIDCNGDFEELTGFYSDFADYLKKLALNEINELK